MCPMRRVWCAAGRKRLSQVLHDVTAMKCIRGGAIRQVHLKVGGTGTKLTRRTSPSGNWTGVHSVVRWEGVLVSRINGQR